MSWRRCLVVVGVFVFFFFFCVCVCVWVVFLLRGGGREYGFAVYQIWGFRG